MGGGRRLYLQRGLGLSSELYPLQALRDNGGELNLEGQTEDASIATSDVYSGPLSCFCLCIF